MKQQFLSGVITALLTTGLAIACKPVQAFNFGTGGIQFDQDTQVDFTFEQSHGPYLSGLYIYRALPEQSQYFYQQTLFVEQQPADNGSSDGWKGTFGNAVTSLDGKITQSFTFLQGQTYSLILWSDGLTGNPFDRYVSSTTALNIPFDPNFKNGANCQSGCQQAVFGTFNLSEDGSQSFTAINNGAGPAAFQSLSVADLEQGSRISFDDRSNPDQAGFRSFTVGVRRRSVPEPSLLIGLGSIAAVSFCRRRHKAQDLE